MELALNADRVSPQPARQLDAAALWVRCEHAASHGCRDLAGQPWCVPPCIALLISPDGRGPLQEEEEEEEEEEEQQHHRQQQQGEEEVAPRQPVVPRPEPPPEPTSIDATMLESSVAAPIPSAPSTGASASDALPGSTALPPTLPVESRLEMPREPPESEALVPSVESQTLSRLQSPPRAQARRALLASELRPACVSRACGGSAVACEDLENVLECDACSVRWQSAWWYAFLQGLSGQVGDEANGGAGEIDETAVAAREAPARSSAAAARGRAPKRRGIPHGGTGKGAEAAADAGGMCDEVAAPAIRAAEGENRAAQTAAKKAAKKAAQAEAAKAVEAKAEAEAAAARETEEALKAAKAQARKERRMLYDDCGECPNCLDKPKYGGNNTRRQACLTPKLKAQGDEGGTPGIPLGSSSPKARARPTTSADEGCAKPPSAKKARSMPEGGAEAPSAAPVEALPTEDCGRCVNCLDKKKFGGPGTKKQKCRGAVPKGSGASASIRATSPDAKATSPHAKAKASSPTPSPKVVQQVASSSTDEMAKARAAAKAKARAAAAVADSPARQAAPAPPPPMLSGRALERSSRQRPKLADDDDEAAGSGSGGHKQPRNLACLHDYIRPGKSWSSTGTG